MIQILIIKPRNIEKIEYQIFISVPIPYDDDQCGSISSK